VPHATGEIKTRLRATPTLWCPGCSNGIVTRAIIDALLGLQLDPEKVAVIAGIGCAGRITSYLEYSTVHTAHGRALAVATGAKAAAPDLQVLVVMGDGDCVAIGGNHLIHAARRNIDIDLATIIYTSGSTGEPKGVMLTHRNMLTAATSISAYLEISSEDVILCILPLSFDYGLYQMIMAFRQGARLVLEQSFTFPAEVLQEVVEEKVTGFPGVPTIFAILAEMKNLDIYDFSGIRFVTNTAAALPIKQIEALKRTFPRAKIFSMYGLTECKRCTYLPPEDLDRKPESVGIAIPNTEIWIEDEKGNRLGPGQVGQLVVRGATVMKGYWGKPEATAKKLRPGPLPGEMTLYTGDYCKLDEEGYLYFVGRMDDIIKSRGEKVPPREVENVLMNIRGVKEAAVIGVPNAVLGQAIKAFVVLESGIRLTVKEIQRECLDRLENFMVPQEIELVPDLPKTPSGKITKSGLS